MAEGQRELTSWIYHLLWYCCKLHLRPKLRPHFLRLSHLHVIESIHILWFHALTGKDELAQISFHWIWPTMSTAWTSAKLTRLIELNLYLLRKVCTYKQRILNRRTVRRDMNAAQRQGQNTWANTLSKLSIILIFCWFVLLLRTQLKCVRNEQKHIANSCSFTACLLAFDNLTKSSV